MLVERIRETLSAASNKTMLDAVGFSALMAWVLLSLPLYLLNSRLIYNHLFLLAGVFAASLAVVALFPKIQSFLQQRFIFLSCGLCAFICGVGFLMPLASTIRLVFVCLQFAFIAFLILGWSAQLARHSLRAIMLTCSGSILVSTLLHFAALSIGSAIGTTANVSNYTTAALVMLTLLPALSAIIFTVSKRHYDDANEPNLKPLIATENYKMANKSHVARKLDTLFLTSAIILCAGSLVASFFNGLTFNPYLNDVISINSVCLAIAGAFSLVAFIVCALIDKNHCAVALSWILILTLVMIVCAIVLFTLNPFSDQTIPIALMLASGDLFFELLFVFACGQRSQRLNALEILAIMLLGSGYLYASAFGLYVKRMIGYSLTTITPLVIIAISLLAIIYFLQSLGILSKAVEPEPSFDLSSVSDEEIKNLVDERRNVTFTEFNFTKREREISLLAIQGFANMSIAEHLGISEKTVGFHLSNAYRKAHVASKRELAALVETNMQSNISHDRIKNISCLKETP